MKKEYAIIKSIAVEDAVQLLLAHDFLLTKEEVNLYEAGGRVLAEDVFAKIPSPPFAKSCFDGYAIRSEDSRGASSDQPVRLKIVDVIPAGTVSEKSLGPGEAAKIMTGAPVPNGADVCLKFEETNFADDWVEIHKSYDHMQNVIIVGEDFPADSLIVSAGDVLNPGRLGLLGNQGMATVQVYKKPVCGVFTTGSELTELGQDLGPGKIYNSNSLAMQEILKNIGFEVVNLGICEDNEAKIASLVKTYAGKMDVLISTGGASVGDYDFGLSSMVSIGAEILFWKTKMKPGGAIVASHLDGTLVLGLSGNPASAIMTLLRVCLPALYKACGHRKYLIEAEKAYLKEDFQKTSNNPRMLRGQLSIENGKAYFIENRGRGNGNLLSFRESDAIAEIPGGSGPLPADSLLTIYRVGKVLSC